MTFFILLGLTQKSQIIEIRNAYYASTKNYKAAKDFANQINRLNHFIDPVLIGYKGMTEFVFSYHSYNPYRKLEHFHKGKKLLEQAIQMDAKSIELLFLRFSVQTNCPFFLNYSDNIPGDKKALITYLINSQFPDPDLKNRVKDYLLQSKFLNKNEKNEIKALKF